MEIITLLAFVALAVAPLALAMRYGDRMLDALSRRKRERKKISRQRKTRSLPIRAEEANRLLVAEEQRNALDDRIAEGLEAFARLSSVQLNHEPEEEIEAIEQTILANESRFSIYLDYAWFQSETLEVLTEEARLLRLLADLPEEGLRVSSSDQPREEKPRSAADKLIASLQDALNRKSKAEKGLGQIGKQKGTHFDVTIDDTHP
jgi:hypothetical protein